MDLKQAFKVTIESLDKREQEIAQEKHSLLEKEAVLNRREKELAEAIKQLEAEQRAVKDIKDVKAQKEANIQKDKDLRQIQVELNKKEKELKQYENKLYEISMQQKDTDERLRVREQEVSHREKTYKEEVEKAFAANLAKNLLTK